MVDDTVKGSAKKEWHFQVRKAVFQDTNDNVHYTQPPPKKKKVSTTKKETNAFKTRLKKQLFFAFLPVVFVGAKCL